MGLDPIVVRRFDELAAKADAVAASRVHDFTSDEGVPYFKIPEAQMMGWVTNVQNLLERIFGKDSVHVQRFVEAVGHSGGWESGFQTCRAIFLAAREDFEGGYLFNVRSLAKAEVLADAMAQAGELLHSGYKDPACVLARVALESTLKDLADRFGVPLAKLDKMNADLCKAGAYNMAKQKQITAWADIGNKAAHGDWSEYSAADAEAMVRGVEALTADLL
jgi:hypothetical protein